MSDLVDALTGFAVVGLPALCLTLCVALVTTSRSRRVALCATGLGFTGGGAVVVYWYLWGLAFDATDASRPVPPSIRVGMDVAGWVGAAVLLGLVALAGLAVRSRPGR